MECDRPDTSRDGVRQGDILAAHPGTDNWNDKWRRFYVVVTADCDMAQRKNAAGVVVVPIIGLATYVDELWLADQVEKYKKLMRERLEPLLNRFSGPRMSVDEALQLDKASFAEALAARAEGSEDALEVVSKATASHADLQILMKINAESSSENAVTRMENFFLVKGRYTGKDVDREKELLGALNGLLDSKRIDTWPICDLLGLDGQMREDEGLGFVACLRYFTTVDYEKAFINKDLWLKDRGGYFRICRLRGMYKTDLIQKFAQMFSRVGLENEREKEHQRVFVHAASRINKRKAS